MARYLIYSALFLATVLVSGMAVMSAQSNRPDAKAQRPVPSAVLVELFTSEGCSSCPPADALLRKVDGKYTDSGQLIVGVSEHVTYWNDLGWSDPFSSEAYTERQSAYGQRFHLDSIYTPQMVINGEEQIVGSDSSGLLRAIRKEEQQPHVDIHIASARLSGGSLSLDFSVSGSIPARGAEIYAILVEDAASSHVLGGENSGRTLSHASVARTITRVATIQAASERTIHLPLSASLQFSNHGGQHLILFAQAPGFGPVLGVDTTPL
jgi:hypothetical protein